ncbi:hypothetical protein [Coralloluteibacterium stylophorae]|uniref:Uncharacterized protein n=1 Tax=Coralloluteibacterium stylophorae TaxID=1776034 RepID=A0A8J7VVY4_9GAMM|nr:hypothetical protein [Coralloluteibacterium stylophorae]MBS7457636.1 hypothetical protein [Coralloluteibacterium stylophorae]
MKLAVFLVPLLLFASVATVFAVARLRAQRRQRTLARLLDGADEVERLLYRTRRRMSDVGGVLGRVPEDIGASARASLDSEGAIQDALRDVLQHRLWIDRHGADASQDELDAACAAMDRARERIDGELRRLEGAAAALAEATDAVMEAAAREPDALRRH